MTQRLWLAEATRRLTAAACEDAAFDARCLLEDFGGLPRGGMPSDAPLTAERAAMLERMLCRRETGEPLQYILGEWEFLNLTLRVGEGVLIPRPDTELLCETAAEKLKGWQNPAVLDLCAGSGCVGLGVASLCPTAQVTAVELSEAALPYLRENVSRYPHLSVTVRQGNVLTDWTDYGMYDAVLSNPPYIPTADLAGLMREVQYEPKMALDGAEDGLLFYRVIASEWCSHLRDGGFCAVEVGFDQAERVAELFRAAGLKNVAIFPDLAGIPRVVAAEK